MQRTRSPENQHPLYHNPRDFQTGPKKFKLDFGLEISQTNYPSVTLTSWCFPRCCSLWFGISGLGSLLWDLCFATSSILDSTFWMLDSGFGFVVYGSWFLVSGFWSVSGLWLLVYVFSFMIGGFGFLVSGFWFLDLRGEPSS